MGSDGYTSDIVYHAPETARGFIAPSYGEVVAETLGNVEDFDIVIILDNPRLNIDGDTVLYIDSVDKPDYVVKKITRLFNTLVVGANKVV